MKIERIKFRVGMMSLVGINREQAYPLSFGNYCSIGNYYCCNMWAENINEYNKLHPEITEVEVAVFGNHVCYVTDERIPLEWRNSFCLTGSGGLKIEDKEELLAFAKQSTEDKICGCEKKGTIPEIIDSFSVGSKVIEHLCCHCKREWTTPNPHYREPKLDDAKPFKGWDSVEFTARTVFNPKNIDKLDI